MAQFGSGNPYQTPPPYQAYGNQGGSREAALARTWPVGLCFVIVGALGGLGMAIYFVLTLIGLQADPNLGRPPGGFRNQGEEVGFYVGYYGMLGLMVFNTLIQFAAIWGGINMMQLRGRGVALFAAILCLVPCVSSPCCIGGIPFGIWALIVLADSDVKRHFQ